MPFATSADGARIHYVVDGDAAAEPLLLVAGQGSGHVMWDPVVEDFAAAHRVVRWDHRGTGESDKPEAPPYSIPMFATDALAVLDDLGIARAHVYGVSMGGRIAQRLAISWPDRVGAVVLGCTTPGNVHGVPRPPDVDARMANRPTGVEESVRFMASIMVSDAWAEAHPAYLDALRARAAQPIPRHAQQLHYAASEAHEAWAELPSVRAPVLVIHGTADEVNVTANGPLLAGRIPGASLHLVEGGRHGYFVEFQEEASRVVLEFLAKHPL
jgi:pimeloyl-ACP methyl ester carboxylesterase